MDQRLDDGQTSLVSSANLMSAKDVREKARHGLDGRSPEGNSASRLAISDSKNPFLPLVVPEASCVHEDEYSESSSARAPVRVLMVASGNDTAPAPQVKLGSYDGSTPYEEFRLKFDLVAGMNGWTPRTKLCQLVVEGNAKQVLYAMGPIGSVDVLHQALSRHFRDTTPPLSDRQQFHQRVCPPAEPLSLLMGHLRCLAQCSYPLFSEEVRDALVLDAFIRGVTSESLQQQLCLMQFTTSVEALGYALTIKGTFSKQPVPPAGSWSSQPRWRSRAAALPPPETMHPCHHPP